LKFSYFKALLATVYLVIYLPLRVVDNTTGRLSKMSCPGTLNKFTFVTFSPDGEHIISASFDQMILLWDAEIGEVVIGLLDMHTDRAHCVAFSGGSCWTIREVNWWVLLCHIFT
jgi:WD40 repeat protein